MNIVWSLTKIKILGVYIGHGDLAEANWRLLVDAVDRCLKSWRSRSLSYSGKALVANSLALSCVWYVASLVHMPAWVSAELKKLLFNFSGRAVLIHPKESGGFSFVSIDFKVAALLIQWVCRLVVCPNGWVYLLTYWLLDRQCHSFCLFLKPLFFSRRSVSSFLLRSFSGLTCCQGWSLSFGPHPRLFGQQCLPG